MKIVCAGCKDEIKDPIWYQREILNQMTPEIEFVHSHCKEVKECFDETTVWEESSHMLIASRALKIAADALNEVGQNPRTSNVKNRDGRFFGVLTFASSCDAAKTLMNAKHEQVKRKLEEGSTHNSGTRN